MNKENTKTKSPKFKQKYLLLGILSLILSIITLLLACKFTGTTIEIIETKTTQPSIAVLPFQDMSSDNSQAYFGDGIAEEILNTLANLEGLRVAGRTSSFSFKGKDATIETIGKALKVEHILEGSVRREGNKLRITAQLIKVADGFHLWSHKYDRDFEDVFKIQDEVAQNIGTILLKKLVPTTNELKAQPAQNSEAYGLFLRAKHIHLNRYYGNYNQQDFLLSERLFQKAIELDTNYALAYAGLADLYDSHKDALSDPSALKHYDHLKIKLIEKAWLLGPELPYVNIVRGWVMRNKKVEPNDLDAAYDNFLRGYQLNPSNTDGLFALAFLLEDKSLFEDADKLLTKAIETDPLRSANYTVKADFLMRIGQYEVAKAAIENALTVNPTDLYALSQLAMNYIFLKKQAKALAIYEQMNQIDSAYLNKSVIDKKLYALVKGDLATARNIPTSLLDYRGENVIVNSIIGEVDSLETSFLKWWDWYQSFKGERSISQSSAYLEFRDNPVYHPLKNKLWFNNLMEVEKKKYDHFLVTYPRAENFLAPLTTKSLAAQEETNPNSLPITPNYILYFLLSLLLVLGILYGFAGQKTTSTLAAESPSNKIATPAVVTSNLFLLELNKIIENQLSNSTFGIPYLCKALGISRAQLYRNIKEHTGTSPALYIRSLRLQKAQELLATSELNISEIAYEVGFKDLSYFSRSFSEEFGQAPSETRK